MNLGKGQILLYLQSNAVLHSSFPTGNLKLDLQMDTDWREERNISLPFRPPPRPVHLPHLSWQVLEQNTQGSEEGSRCSLGSSASVPALRVLMVLCDSPYCSDNKAGSLSLHEPLKGFIQTWAGSCIPVIGLIFITDKFPKSRELWDLILFC